MLELIRAWSPIKGSLQQGRMKMANAAAKKVVAKKPAAAPAKKPAATAKKPAAKKK